MVLPYIFKSRRGLDRSAWKIKPTGYIDDELAIQHRDDILRLIATIKESVKKSGVGEYHTLEACLLRSLSND